MIQLKTFGDFGNCIELFTKIQSGKKKLEDTKELQNIFKSNVNEISTGRFKSKEKQTALKILNFSTNHDKLLSNCLMISSISSEPKHKAKRNSVLNKCFKDYK